MSGPSDRARMTILPPFRMPSMPHRMAISSSSGAERTKRMSW
ncbi:hypothetical protein [Methanogenium cariaci]|nr:hypothetical protein [Methanogenium cariaci]